MCRSAWSVAFFLLANLTALSPARAAGLGEAGPEATLSWRLEFGAGGLHPGYALAVGYRSIPGQPAGELLAVDISDRAALARLAGVSLADRSYRADEAEDGALPSEPAARPWYARQWVLWTAGGLAATLAATGGDGSIEYNDNGGTTNRGGDSCTGVGVDANGQSTPCANETVGTQCVEGSDGQMVCVFCGSNGVTDGCNEWTDRRVVASRVLDPRLQRWLDAGTGHMGDLFAR